MEKVMELKRKGALTKKNKREDNSPPSLFAIHRNAETKEKVSATRAQARKLGLEYLGFGRYGTNKKGSVEVTHIVKDGRLMQLAPSKMTTDRQYPSVRSADPSLARAHDYLNDPLGNAEAGSVAQFTGMVDRYARNKKEKAKFNDPHFKKYDAFVDAQHQKLKGEDKRYIEAAQKVLSGYQSGDDWTAINHLLFNQAQVEEKDKKDQVLANYHKSVVMKVRMMDSLFKKDLSTVDTPMTVYTGTRALGGLKKDGKFVFHGFMSTSIDPTVAVGFAKGTSKTTKEQPGDALEIEIKKGQKAISMDSFTNRGEEGGNDDSLGFVAEKEMLLNRGNILHVKDGPIILGDGTRLWKAEIVGNTRDEDHDNAAIS